MTELKAVSWSAVYSELRILEQQIIEWSSFEALGINLFYSRFKQMLTKLSAAAWRISGNVLVLLETMSIGSWRNIRS